MGRHEKREQVFKLLFRVEFNGQEDMQAQARGFSEDEEEGISQKDAEYVRGRFEQIWEKFPEIDRLIEENTDGWTMGRMGKVELAVLRLGVYEVMFDQEVPDSVAINEAVEIAKKYGQEMSGGFVNAILAKIVKLKN